MNGSCDDPYCVECFDCVCIRYACCAHVYVMMAAFCCYKFFSHSFSLTCTNKFNVFTTVHKHSDCIHNTCRDTPIMLNASGDISIMCMCLACSTQQRSLLYCYCIQLAHGDICCFWKSSLARLLTSPVCYVYTGTPLTPFSY